MVLVKNDLRDVVTAIDLSSKTFNRIRLNYMWATAYNILGMYCAMSCVVFTAYRSSALRCAGRIATGCWCTGSSWYRDPSGIGRFGNGLLIGISRDIIIAAAHLQETHNPRRRL
jgi:hypothetical protein